MLDNTSISQIKKAIKDGISRKEIAGANMMVIQGGKEIFYHEDGYADIEAKLPMKRDSIFRLYSMSKPITAAAAMILLERGEIDLFDPVSKFLCGFKNQKTMENGRIVPVNREMNIKDLLSMTSGLVYGGNTAAGRDTDALFKEIDARLLGDSPLNTIEICNRLGQCTLAFHPGSYFEYGTSADVLGAVIEVASGMSFGEFLKKEIFEPLEMKDTAFWVPDEKRSRLAKTYQAEANGDLTVYTGNNLGIINKMDRQPAFESGGAGLVSTIDDYSKFAGILLNQGNYNGIQILRPKTVKYFTSATLSEDQQKGADTWVTLAGYSYGNLMRVLTDTTKVGGLGSLGEYGWDGWLGPYLCNCPKDDLTFLFMIQKTDAGTTPLTRKLRNIVFSSCCE